MLRFSSCQAENAEAFCAQLAAFAGEKLGMKSEFIGDIPWQERERLFYRGDIHVCWICGLPYIRKNNSREKTVELLAAPVMKHPRYQEKPIYYSDVLVHADSNLRSFEDLRGRTWAYNEPGSHSGYSLIRYHLAVSGLGAGYFGRVVESGAHQTSLRMILDREIDATAIDSTVLEMALARNPSIAGRIRTIATLGPGPARPWLAHGSVSIDVKRALRRVFLSMNNDPHGRQMLESAGMLRFAEVSDADYNPIREMERIAATIQWPGDDVRYTAAAST